MSDREPFDYLRLLETDTAQIGIPLVIEIVCVTLFLAAGFVWLIIAATPGAPV